MKCCYCKRRFALKSQNRYLSVEPTSLSNVFSGGGIVYDSFDCPHCGCQHRIAKRYVKIEKPVQTDAENNLDEIPTIQSQCMADE